MQSNPTFQAVTDTDLDRLDYPGTHFHKTLKVPIA